MIKQHSTSIKLAPTDNQRLADLCGQCDENLRLLEKHLDIEINHRGNLFHLSGSENGVNLASQIIEKLYQSTTQKEPLTPARVHLFIREAGIHTAPPPKRSNGELGTVSTSTGQIKARNANQELYLKNISNNDLNFGVGPAGTGKTYLAVACAVDALLQERVRRIVLVRPAVEAGEKLGFLPGDMAQKVDPYLRPLYDALFEMLGFDQVAKMLERGIIEVAPLAYMRGRTLNDAFIILDESQNTTKEQMKMFLTRMGFGSTVVVTGDVTQIDLPKGMRSGLKHVVEVLKDLENVSFTFFKAEDAVRHPLIQRIVEAYDIHEKSTDDKEAILHEVSD